MLLTSLILFATGASATCLALGYAAAWGGMAGGVALITLLSWYLSYKRPSLCPPLAALILSLGLAVGGLFIGGTSWPILLAAISSLATWDLVRQAHSLANCTSSSPESVAAYQSAHYKMLGAVIGASVLIILIGRLVPLQIPLGGMILLIVLAFVAFERAWRNLSHS